MSDMPEKPQNGRNPLSFMGGLVLLGFAAALLLFGGSLFGGGSAVNETAELQQIPALDSAPSLLSQQSGVGGPLAVGAAAYDFTLSDVAGNPVSLSDFRGRPVILNFWATWCAPCRIEMPDLERAFLAHQENDLVILAINQGESAAVVQAFFYDELGLSFTPLLDTEVEVSNLFSAFNLPTTIFIAADGTVTAIHRGLLLPEQIEGYLAQTLSG
jgi:peroxiredoxin